MNLTPTEMDRLTIFTAAEMARRNRKLGIRLSHPEAVALITDEVMLAARRDMPYAEIRDMASRLLTTDDVEPGVAEMTPMIYIECAFAEGTKLLVLFEPISIGHLPLLETDLPRPGLHARRRDRVLRGWRERHHRRGQHRRPRRAGAQPHALL